MSLKKTFNNYSTYRGNIKKACDALGYIFNNSYTDFTFQQDGFPKVEVRDSTLDRLSTRAADMLMSYIWTAGIETLNGEIDEGLDKSINENIYKIIKYYNDFGFVVVVKSKKKINVLHPREVVVLQKGTQNIIYYLNDDQEVVEASDVWGDSGKQYKTTIKIDNDKPSVRLKNKVYYILNRLPGKALKALPHHNNLCTIMDTGLENYARHAEPAIDLTSGYAGKGASEYTMEAGAMNIVSSRPDEGVKPAGGGIPDLTQQTMMYEQLQKTAMQEIYDIDLLLSENPVPACRNIANDIYGLVRELKKEKDLQFRSLVADSEVSTVIQKSNELAGLVTQLSQVSPEMGFILDYDALIRDIAEKSGVFGNIVRPVEVVQQLIQQQQQQAAMQQEIAMQQK